MGIFSGVKRATKSLVDVPRWMQLERLSEMGSGVVELGKAIFIPRKAERTESFEEALKRLNLTEQDIQQRKREFKRLLLIFIFITLLLFSYTLYLFITGSFRGGLVAAVVTFIGLSQLFYYHFWLYQLKQRKLGVTFWEWFYQGVLGQNK